MFQFSNISNIEVATFDNSLGNFYQQGIEGTIREDGQNALDAHLKDSEEPVRLKITLGEVSKNKLPGIEEVFHHINSLVGSNAYTSEIIEYMKKREALSIIPVLTIEDENTKGLTGAINGQSNNREDTFGVYAYSKGIHSIVANTEHEESRGGSHGIGKIANNASSDIHLMYFSNCDQYGHQHLGGTVHLIEHNVDSQAYRSTGYFTDIEELENRSKFIPFENRGFDPIFSKDTRGLKIIIPYLREEFNNPQAIIRAVCDNFFLAILEKKLEVSIEIDGKEELINNETLIEFVEDNRLYETEISQIKDNHTPLYVKTYLNQEPMSIKVSNISDEYNFDLYFTYNDEIPTGRVGIIRTIGMKIEDFKVKSNIRRPFNAVLIGNGPKEDSYLKSLENESHTKISASSIRDDKEKKNAIRFISNLNKVMGDIIAEHVQQYNQTDGIVDTSDLLYETETSFKNDLSRIKEKITVITGEPIFKQKTNKEKRKPKEKEGKEGNKKTGRKQVRKPRVVQPGDNQENEKKKLILPTDTVQRSVTNEYEILKLNFQGINDNELWKKCNISFKVVDGMGKEHSNEINLLDSYSKIYNYHTKEPYCYDEKKINNVGIKEGTVFLKMDIAERFNKNLKFLYVVEVENDL